MEEGLCQYVAANVARRYKAPNALRAIEEMPDEVYGDGYRYFAAKLGPNNWPGAIAWLRSTKVEVLPSKPPK